MLWRIGIHHPSHPRRQPLQMEPNARHICRPEGSNPAGLMSQIFLYICSPNLVSRNTNRQISEKRISDQARSTRRIFVHSETKGANNRYFEGPILDKSARKWRQTHYIRACEEIPSDEERELVRKNGLTFDVDGAMHTDLT